MTHESCAVTKSVLIILHVEFELFIASHVATPVVAKFLSKTQPWDIGSYTLQDMVTWYTIRHAGTQITHWNIQNKVRSSLTGGSYFVLVVPFFNLRPGMANFVLC